MLSRKIITCAMILKTLYHGSNSFMVSKPMSSGIDCCREGAALNAIEVPSLDAIDNDHEKEATRLAKSIIGWLDREWIPQEVHVQMAQSVERSYIKARNDGETEVSAIVSGW